ncbi:MAG: hypothetical protein AB8G99_13985 [Planctomycetaceae bacterium]
MLCLLQVALISCVWTAHISPGVSGWWVLFEGGWVGIGYDSPSIGTISGVYSLGTDRKIALAKSHFGWPIAVSRFRKAYFYSLIHLAGQVALLVISRRWLVLAGVGEVKAS